MIRISSLRADLNYESRPLQQLVARALKVSADSVRSVRIVKKSVDARDKGDVHFVLTLDADISPAPRHLPRNCQFVSPEAPQPALSPRKLAHRPLVVGMGPAGLFCALTLAELCLNPIVIERGRDVDTRTQDVQRYWNGGPLDVRSNVQYGEGGAGTFSDGKLTTGIKDKRIHKVLETFVRFGAPEEILYRAKPHVGTDLLKGVVKGMREEIIRLGGEVHFETRLVGIRTQDDHVTGAVVAALDGERLIETDDIVLAIGHSARDTFRTLHAMGVPMEPKAFSIGARIEHKQSMIDRSQYGPSAGHPALGAADYKVNVTLPSGRGVYTFCMCPGGQVVAAASADGTVVTNGMSLHARDGENANAALLVGITPDDFDGDDVLAGVAFQEKWERAAYIAGGSNAFAPAQKVGDLIADRPSAKPGKVRPSYRPGVTWTTLRECLPAFAYESLREAIPLLDRRIKGFADPDAVLTGVETRSSSPVRILRDAAGQSALRGLYPTGEGAGYAGGITSAAVDGIRAAEHVATGE